MPAKQERQADRSNIAPSDDVPAVRRLAAFAALGKRTRVALARATVRPVRRGGNLVDEGRNITRRLLILDGWAARTRVFHGGRLQLMSFLLPGDLIGNCHHMRPLSVSSVTALTDITYCVAPPPDAYPRLSAAYTISQAFEEAYLLEQIARLGRLTAEERLIDFLLELVERLSLCGLVENGGFRMPLTQQVLADAMGLTVVHVNRMLRQLRRQGDIQWSGGVLTLADPAALAARIGRTPTRVTASRTIPMVT